MKRYFRVSSGLKSIIGKDLITDDLVALYELVKNSYDADATYVKLVFTDIGTEGASIIVEDNGIGMNLNDILEKWLFIAYSEKTKDSQDEGYRSRIFSNRRYAGAKGIGRFSCDQLAQQLDIYSCKLDSDPVHLQLDWDQFEIDQEKEISEIPVEVISTSNTNNLEGTRLVLTNLRSPYSWTYNKLSKLRSELAKLINPFKSANDKNFIITLKFEGVPKEANITALSGDVSSDILGILQQKTSKIVAEYNQSNSTYTTSIYDGGILVYTLTEKMNDLPISSYYSELYYLHRTAKVNFSRTMGMTSRSFGSIFMFKNDIRVLPYGEPGDDSLGLEARKVTRRGSYLGINETIGQIRIIDSNNTIKESSSRDAGFIRGKGRDWLIQFFISHTLKRLERYVIDIKRWGVAIDDEDFSDYQAVRDGILELITDYDTEDVVDFILGDWMDLFDRQDPRTKSEVAKNIDQLTYIAKKQQNPEMVKAVTRLAKVQQELVDDRVAVEREKVVIEKDLARKEKEVLFFRANRSGDVDHILFLHHLVGISVDTAAKRLQTYAYKLQTKRTIDPDSLFKMIGQVTYELGKISTITSFATKANFNMSSEIQFVNVAEYLDEYINNVVQPLFTDIKISFTNEGQITADMTLKPILISMMVDNFISNSRKASAQNIDFLLKRQHSAYVITVTDNGQGVPQHIETELFKMGKSTTSGSGMGLPHIVQIADELNGKIALSSPRNPTIFEIQLPSEYV